MHFSRIKLINYRNFINLSLNFHPNLNIFIGDNAQGKTNILEAITVLIRGNSYKNIQDKQLINWNSNLSLLSGEIKKNNEQYEINISLEKERGIKSLEPQKITKIIKVNQIIQKKSSLNKEFKGVFFSPEHLQIIKGSPSLRRKFLDEQISQIYPLYQRYLFEYQRILAHRNNILKKYDDNKIIKENLRIWNPQLIKRGAFLISMRTKFLKKMDYIANNFHQQITQGKEKLSLFYQNNIIKDFKEEEIELISNRFKERLEQEQKREIEYKTSLYGPHRDDFLVFLNHINTLFYGSQGQQRTVILSLKLGELEIIKEKEGVYPIFLLDDVMSELDEKRRHFLLDLILNKKLQTFITSINLNYFNPEFIKLGRIFKVEEGRALVL
ncbi:MAG: DNA replication/repair protein RecF [Candidatus Caldatribacteriota bacterium]